MQEDPRAKTDYKGSKQQSFG